MFGSAAEVPVAAQAPAGSPGKGQGREGWSLPWQEEGAGVQKGAEPGAGVSSELWLAELLALVGFTMLHWGSVFFPLTCKRKGEQ